MIKSCEETGKRNRSELNYILPYIKKNPKLLNFDGIEFPTEFKDETFALIEKNNPSIALKVYYFHHEDEDDKQGKLHMSYCDESIYKLRPHQIKLIYLDPAHHPNIKPAERPMIGHFVLLDKEYQEIIMPKPDEKTPNIMPKVTFDYEAKKQVKCPVIVYADFEAMNVKYTVPEGNKMKLLTNHVASMGCCTVVYNDGKKETVTFRNTPDKPCYVAMVEYLNELSLEIKMKHIDHHILSPDWRLIEKSLLIKQRILLAKWMKTHESKTHCDICHNEFKSFCSTCDKNKDKDKFEPCVTCVNNKANGNKHYDHCHLTGMYRSSACHTCNTRRLGFSPSTYKLTVLFHNSEGYDNHFMFNAMFEMGDRISQITIDNINKKLENYSERCKERMKKILSNKLVISAIPKTSEKVLTLSNGLIEIHDSYKLTISGLDTLIYNQVWGDPITCTRKGCCKVITDTKKIYYDNYEFVGEFICRDCQEYGHKLPTQIRRVDQRVIHDKFKCMASIVTENGKINNDKLALLLRKGVYPYSYMDSEEKFKESKPSIECFNNDLAKDEKDKACHPDDYDHFVRIYDTFECKNMDDLQEIYIKSDTCGLADVIEELRKDSINKFGMDIVNFITLSSFADASLKRMIHKKYIETGVDTRPELLTSQKMYELFEKNIRGGLCNGGKRYSRAYNKHMKGYDAEKCPRHFNYLTKKFERMQTYITYLDAVSMYNGVMCMKLPYAEFVELVGEKFKCFCDRKLIADLDDDGEYGYAYEVDIRIPKRLHDYMNDLPPLCTSRKVDISELSEDQINARKSFGETEDKIKASLNQSARLVSSLDPVTNHLCHYRKLKFLLRKGAEIVKIHSIIQFKQTHIYKDYMEACTSLELRQKMRAHAHSSS